jgi:hypothetical protein
MGPRGGQGLTRTTIALGLLTLVGVALTALLVGDSTGASDLLKTVVTALTTALTTVVGFYFGARTAADAAAAQAGGPGAPPGSTTPTGSTTPGGTGGDASTTTVPDPPSDVTAASTGPGTVEVTFVGSANTGGSAITEYTAVSDPEGRTAKATGPPITVTGLARGTDYTFRVQAANASGSSKPSAPSPEVTAQ